MTSGGWIIMTLSVSFVTVLFAWCIWKVLTTPTRSEHLHGTKNIEPDDVRGR